MAKVTVGSPCPVFKTGNCYAGCMFFDHRGQGCSVAAAAEELLDNLRTQHESAAVKAPKEEK